MTKADAIRKLWVKLPDTRDKTRLIADHVGCGTAYVRTVARQRVNGRSAYDETWLLRKFGGKTLAEAHRNRWRQDQKYRATKLRYMARRHKAQKHTEAHA